MSFGLSVRRIRPTVDVAEPLEIDDLGHRLLRHPRSIQVGQADALRWQVGEDGVVCGTDVVEPAGVEPPHELVAEAGGEQARQRARGAGRIATAAAYRQGS